MQMPYVQNISIQNYKQAKHFTMYIVRKNWSANTVYQKSIFDTLYGFPNFFDWVCGKNLRLSLCICQAKADDKKPRLKASSVECTELAFLIAERLRGSL